MYIQDGRALVGIYKLLCISIAEKAGKLQDA